MHTRLIPVLSLSLIATFHGPVSAEERFFDSNGVKIRYLIHGKGEAVVLLHGFASTAEMWDKKPPHKSDVWSELAKDYRVIAIDCRGHGKSDKPHDPKKYGKEVIEDVVRLLDHLSIEKAHVVGYSMGAEIAGHLLVKHPNRLLSVTLGGGVPLFEPTLEVLDKIELAAKSLEAGKGIAPVIMAAPRPPGQPKPTPEIAEYISKVVIGNQDQKALAASVRSGKELEVTEAQLKTNRLPVLVVYGSNDGVEAMQKHFNRVAKLMNANVQVVEGGDHVGTLAKPKFLETIQEFLKKHKE